jgi:succinate-semialdehyde dehydrogenase
VIDRGVDLEDAAEKITAGAAFDNGIICSHEQFVLTPREQYKDTIAAFVKTGAVWFTDDETKIEKLRQVVFPNGHLNKDVVGRSAQEIGKRAGIDIPSSAHRRMWPINSSGPSFRTMAQWSCSPRPISPRHCSTWVAAPSGG